MIRDSSIKQETRLGGFFVVWGSAGVWYFRFARRLSYGALFLKKDQRDAEGDIA